MKLVAAFAAAALLAAPAFSAACRDAKGKFIKCPPASTAAAKDTKCRVAKGHFASVERRAPSRHDECGRRGSEFIVESLPVITGKA